MNFLKEIEILRYLIDQINDVETFTSGFDEEMFLRNELVKNGSLMKLIVFGEYSTHIDETLKSRFTEIEWQLIKAARNYYTHAYRGIDWIKVWETINEDVPGLKKKLENIIVILEKREQCKN